ncbi:unnamed protein product [Heligmosomoides polygyrus]|uniref:DNA primase n=1 Tax=Heligmosomoides polygyrus TaxID=6339 RepID=A0A183FL50_HELPZ|nr:unnamed protein product [Heligmosomoides polygyrus]
MREDNIKKLASVLEVYGDRPQDMLPVKDKAETADRIDFIRKCVMKYYGMSDKDDVVRCEDSYELQNQK